MAKAGAAGEWIIRSGGIMDADPTVRFEMRDGIALITLTGTSAGNAIDLPFSRRLLEVTYGLEAAAPRVVLLQSASDNFCFGGNLRCMQDRGDRIGPYLSELTSTLHTAIGHLSRFPAPVLAAVQGAAAGAGLGLVLAADLVIAAETARFSAAYLGVGLTPDAGCSFSLSRAVGSKRAMEMFLTNRTLSATEALSWGMINRVVPDHQLASAALAWAGQVAQGSLAAYEALKALLADSEPGLESQLARESRTISRLGAYPEAAEGIAAFLEKRAPKFSGFQRGAEIHR